jgi:outer membrane protein OmpA-like peptidoglycan-associated protein
MRSLTTRRRRPCWLLWNGVAVPVLSLPEIGWRLALRVVLPACVWIGLTGTTAIAQRSAVTVDLGVLDTLGPADPTANAGNRIRLHRPSQPAQRQTPAAGSKSKPVQASNRPSAAAKSPTRETAPSPQASLAPQKSPSPTASPPQAPAPQASLAPPTSPPSSPSPPPPPAPQASPSPSPSPAPPAPQASLAPPASAAPTPATEPRAAAAATPPADRILFRPDDANLADEAKQELDRLAARLGADGRLYVQLVAYASGGGDASQARRLSLSRALAARSYLVDHGVEIKQIDLRPLGNKMEPGAVPDRIDLVITQR